MCKYKTYINRNQKKSFHYFDGRNIKAWYSERKISLIFRYRRIYGPNRHQICLKNVSRIWFLTNFTQIRVVLIPAIPILITRYRSTLRLLPWSTCRWLAVSWLISLCAAWCLKTPRSNLTDQCSMKWMTATHCGAFGVTNWQSIAIDFCVEWTREYEFAGIEIAWIWVKLI